MPLRQPLYHVGTFMIVSYVRQPIIILSNANHKRSGLPSSFHSVVSISVCMTKSTSDRHTPSSLLHASFIRCLTENWVVYGLHKKPYYLRDKPGIVLQLIEGIELPGNYQGIEVGYQRYRYPIRLYQTHTYLTERCRVDSP